MSERDRCKEIEERSLRSEGYKYVCRQCGKTPQEFGWCDLCGYNRDYEKVKDRTDH